MDGILESLRNIADMRFAKRDNQLEAVYSVYRDKDQVMTIFPERRYIEIHDAFAKRIRRKDDFRPFVREFRRRGFSANYLFD